MRSSSEEGSYFRLVDFCITQLQAESNKEEEEDSLADKMLDEALDDRCALTPTASSSRGENTP